MKLKIGDVFPDSLLKYKGNGIMISSGEITPSYVLKLDNITYSICKNSKNKISYIQTNDTNFISSEDLKIGMTLAECKTKTTAVFKLERGWAYYVELPSGWKAAFAIINEKEIDETKKLVMFFKRAY